MPAPSTASALPRPDLAGAMMEFDLAANMQGAVATQVFTPISVAKKAGTFQKITIEQLLQAQETKRTSRAGYNRGDYKTETDNYTCTENGWEEPIDEDEYDMYADYFDAEVVASQRAQNFVIRNQEKRVSDLLFNTTTYNTMKTAATAVFSNKSSATPVANFKAAAKAVRAQCGLKANTAIIPYLAFIDMMETDEVIDRVKYAGFDDPKKMTLSAMAALLDLEKIVVPDMLQNTANIAQAMSLSDVWTKTYAMVCRTATSMDFKEPCIGRTFQYRGAGNPMGVIVESYEEPQTRSNVIRVRQDTHEKMMIAEAGHLITGVLS